MDVFAIILESSHIAVSDMAIFSRERVEKSLKELPEGVREVLIEIAKKLKEMDEVEVLAELMKFIYAGLLTGIQFGYWTARQELEQTIYKTIQEIHETLVKNENKD